MKKIVYIAILEPSSDGFGVFFPDVPGCISFGKTFEEAQVNAKEALESHFYELLKDGDEIPLPSKNIDPKEFEGCFVCLITVYPERIKYDMDNRRIKTNCTIPAWLKSMGEAEGINFSKLLEQALVEYLGIIK